MTGFIGADQFGHITTLGRSGSDYTATIIASCIDADEVYLWSDIDGLLTADPLIVSDAEYLMKFLLQRLLKWFYLVQNIFILEP